MKQQFLDDFRNTLAAAEQKLLALSEAQSETPRAAGKWSPKEIIGHLIDSASNNHQRFVRGQLENSLFLLGYEQEKWVAVQNYKSEEWKFLVGFWKSFNTHLLHAVAGISAEGLQYEHILQGKNVTLEFIATDYLEHMKHHLNQIITL